MTLPYNLFSNATNNDILHIIESTADNTDRLVIVSTSEITNLISNTGFKISDYCTVVKAEREILLEKYGFVKRMYRFFA